jgi:hypothetical protein
MMVRKQRTSVVSQAVRGAFETLKGRQELQAPDVRARWADRLDRDAPAPRTVQELLSATGQHGVSVDDLLCLSYCLGVSPTVPLRLAWRQEPWPFLKLARPGMKQANSLMDDWLWGLSPLPYQDALEFAKNMPSKLLYREGGKGLRGEWTLNFHAAVEKLLQAADGGDRAEMKTADAELRNLATALAQLVSQRGPLAKQEE